MARLEAQSKLLYYPTPNSVVEEIAKFFRTPEPEQLKETQVIRLADPAAGTGQALALFREAAGFQAETWGVELSPGRALEAERRLTQVVQGSFYEARYISVWPNASAGLVFDNPPYDWSEYQERNANGDLRRIRHEHLFVEYATRKLVTGGHQVVIIPQDILAGKTASVGAGNQERMARHLLGWYEQAAVFRFPDGEFEAFRQIVILAIGKRRKYAPVKKEALQALMHSAAALPPLAHDGRVFVIPPAPAGLRMTWTPRTPQAVLRAARSRRYLASERYRQATRVRPLGTPFTPIMPLSDKEIASLILGQEAGVVRLTDGSWVKGSVIKRLEEAAETRYDDEGRYTGTKVRQVEKFDDRITILRPWGTVEVVEGRQAVADFIRNHIEEFSREILHRNPPIYDLKPTPQEWETISHVATGLRLPNRDERGLLDVQKHLAIGMARAMRKRKHVILDAEPGFGKTPVTTGILELLGAWPALVVCPGHMPPHWFRILEAASDERERITPRVITRPILGGQPLRFPRLRAVVEANGGRIVSDERYQVYPESPKDPMTRRRVTVSCAPERIDSLVKAVRKTLGRSLNFRDRWTVEVQKDGEQGKRSFSHAVPLDVSITSAGVVFTYVDKDPYTMADFYADYRAGRLGRKAAAIIGFEAAKYDSGFEVDQWGRRKAALMPGIVKEEADGRFVYRKGYLCPACGKPPTTGRRRWSDRCDHCGGALYNFNRWRRVGLARLIQKKYKRFFRVYVADEIHNAKSGDTDIGVADQRIISSVQYSLALTGTLYGGVSTSILYLLYRRMREVRQAFAFPKKFKGEEQRWVSVYGRVERAWYQEEPYAAGTGASTGVARRTLHIKELPYGSPKLVRYLAQVSVAAFIEDLGYALPPLEEDVVRVPPAALQTDEFEKFAQEYREAALKALRSNDPKTRDKGAVSRWYHLFKARPVTGFRDEELDVGRVYSLPAVVGENEYLPKEYALAEVVRRAVSKGRKALVYVEQSGERDIRPRLQRVLEVLAADETGRTPAVGILDTRVRPAQREAWVQHNAQHLDVLLVNPRLVETGLGLTMFSDLVFYEITPVLYRFVQAMKRVWRMGQDKDVRITYLVQDGSLDPIIMERIGKKYQAAQSLRGRLANTAIVDDDDESILQYLLAQDIAKRTGASGLSALARKADLSGIVGNTAKAVLTSSPAGVRSAPVPAPSAEDRQPMQLGLFAGIDAVPASAIWWGRGRREPQEESLRTLSSLFFLTRERAQAMRYAACSSSVKTTTAGGYSQSQVTGFQIPAS